MLIWLVQTIIYPGMHSWEKASFSAQHRRYSRQIAVIVGPLMLGQAALALFQLKAAPGLVTILQSTLIASVWAVTALVSVPLHRRLSTGYDAHAVNRLVSTNWLRTAGWSLVCLLDWLR